MASTTPSTSPDASTARLLDIATAVGTPCYVYDAGVIRAAYATLDDAFGDYPHAIHYALKANSSLAVVRLLHSLGSHGDANSLGEVDVAMRCGFRPDQIVFTGVGKSAAEIDRAVALGLLAINVESPGELDRIDQRAIAQGTLARVALRVNEGSGMFLRTGDEPFPTRTHTIPSPNNP